MKLFTNYSRYYFTNMSLVTTVLSTINITDRTCKISKKKNSIILHFFFLRNRKIYCAFWVLTFFYNLIYVAIQIDKQEKGANNRRVVVDWNFVVLLSTFLSIYPFLEFIWISRKNGKNLTVWRFLLTFFLNGIFFISFSIY